MKIAILTLQPNGKFIKDLVDAGKKRGHEMTIYHPDLMQLYISNVHRKDRLYYEDERIMKKNIDAVITRIGGATPHRMAVLDHLRQNMGMFCTQTVSGIKNASDKLRTTQLLSLKGIKTPRTVYAKGSKNVKHLIELAGGLPVIVKGLQGSQGSNVVILETVLSANSVLESYYKSNQQVIIQEYIKPGKDGAKDIRAIVVGGEVVMSMQRTAPKGDFKANLSLGGSAEPIELTDTQKEICIKASEAIGLETSGVDLMIDENGENYIIEINSHPGTKIRKVWPEINLPEIYIKHVEENHNKPDTRDMLTNMSGPLNQATDQLILSRSDLKERDFQNIVYGNSLAAEYMKDPQDRNVSAEGLQTELKKLFGKYFVQNKINNALSNENNKD